MMNIEPNLPFAKEPHFDAFFEREYMQQIQVAVSSFSGIVATLTTLEGRPLTKPIQFCALCDAIISPKDPNVESSATWTSCEKEKSMQFRCKQLLNEPIRYKCILSGVWEERIALEVGGAVFAYLLISRLQQGALNLSQWEQCANGRSTAAHRPPVSSTAITDAEFVQLVGVLTKIVTLITQLAYNNYSMGQLIVEQRVTGNLLKSTKERHDLILNSAQEGIAVLQEGRFEYANPMIEELTGYSQQELIASHFVNYIHEEDRAHVFDNYTHWMLGEGGAELSQFRLLPKEGPVKWVEVSVRNIEWEGHTATLNFLTDITNRKVAEQSLIESEEKYRLIAENSSDGIVCFDADHQLTYASPAYQNQIGHTEDDLLHLTAEDIHSQIHHEDREQLFSKIFDAIRNKQTCLTYSYRVKHQTGNYIWREDNARFRYDLHGVYQDCLVICRDVSERVRSEQQLKVSEANLREAQRVARMGSWEWSAGSNQLQLSDELFKLFDLDPDTFDGKRESIVHIIHPDDRALFNTKPTSNNGEFPSHPIEIRVMHRDGAVRYVSILRRLECDEQGRPLNGFGVVQDITERVLAEMEVKSHQMTRLLLQHDDLLHEQERLSISAELHDDLGQVLTAVKFELEHLRENVTQLPCLEKFDKTVAMVGDTIRTVQRMTAQLSPNILDELGLKDAIEWFAIDFSKKSGIEIVTELDPMLALGKRASIIVFRILQEALDNTLRHARASKVTVELYEAEQFVYFLVVDDGIGFSPEELSDSKSFGIMGMKEKAIFLGGEVTLSQAEQGGAIVKVKFPLNLNL